MAGLARQTHPGGITAGGKDIMGVFNMGLKTQPGGLMAILINQTRVTITHRHLKMNYLLLILRLLVAYLANTK